MAPKVLLLALVDTVVVVGFHNQTAVDYFESSASG